jgi:hypothetical protein
MTNDMRTETPPNVRLPHISGVKSDPFPSSSSSPGFNGNNGNGNYNNR